MKEYKVQMKLGNGKWVGARRPNLPTGRTFKSMQEAREYMKLWSDTWNVYIEKRRDILIEETLPTEWRIVSREVSEWKCE